MRKFSCSDNITHDSHRRYSNCQVYHAEDGNCFSYISQMSLDDGISVILYPQQIVPQVYHAEDGNCLHISQMILYDGITVICYPQKIGPAIM